MHTNSSDFFFQKFVFHKTQEVPSLFRSSTTLSYSHHSKLIFNMAPKVADKVSSSQSSLRSNETTIIIIPCLMSNRNPLPPLERHPLLKHPLEKHPLPRRPSRRPSPLMEPRRRRRERLERKPTLPTSTKYSNKFTLILEVS